MAHFSTGLGLAVLGGCILGAAAISANRLGGEAFAQGTGTERHIVSSSVYAVPGYTRSEGNTPSAHYIYRIWSDNSVDIRCLGYGQVSNAYSYFDSPSSGNLVGWRTVDNGTSGFRPLTDVDMSGETDAGDISQVLLDFNTSSNDLPPPPIDCTINAPR